MFFSITEVDVHLKSPKGKPRKSKEGKQVVPDIAFMLVFVLFGGLLGLVVEAQKHFYPILLALLLLGAAAILGRLEKAITPKTEE